MAKIGGFQPRRPSVKAKDPLGTEELLDTMLQDSIDAAKYEFDKLRANWAAVEGKAQAAGAVAGAFIAAFVAFIRESSSKSDPIEVTLFLLALFLLLLTIVFTMNCLVLRLAVRAPEYRHFVKMFSDAVASEPEADERVRLVGFHRQHLRLLCECIEVSDKALSIKTRWLLLSQICVSSAVSVASVDLIYRILLR